MIIEKMEFFLHDVFMEIMSNLESLQDYEETIDALEEGCRLNLSSDGETEEEREARYQQAEERKLQLKKQLMEAEKEKERERIERRMRLMDLVREFIFINGISAEDGLGSMLESAMFIPLNAVALAVKKRHPGKDAKDIEFERDDKMLVKAELRRVRLRIEGVEAEGPVRNIKDDIRVMKKAPKQKVL